MDVVIRPARLDDAKEVVRVHERASDDLFLEVVGKRLEDVISFGDRLEQFRESIAKVSEDAQILVAEGRDGLIGLAVLRKVEGEGEVKDLHVVPEAWGRGVARRLMEDAVERLRGMGVERAFLWVGEENPRARRFYEREGWSHDGTSRPSPLGPTELRYTRSIAGPSPQ